MGMPEGRPEPAAGGGRSFLSIARIGSMVGGSTARSCTWYLDDAGLMQWADEETSGTLHALAEGHGDTRSLLRQMAQESPELAPQAPSPAPPAEYYPAKIALTSLSPNGHYRAESYVATAVPQGVMDWVRAVESEVRARHFPVAPTGLYGRARRQINFDPDIEQLHATLTVAQLNSLPLLSALITREMSLVHLGSPGEPGLLAKDLQVLPGRSVRVKVGELVYLIQAYDFRGLQGREEEPCPSPPPPNRRKDRK
jgi:hypothetical protein